MFQQQILLLISYVALTTQNTVSERTFYGNDQQSFAKLEHLKSSEHGMITFEFKTTESDGVLFYADDLNRTRGIGNYLKIVLQNNKVVLYIQISFNEGDMTQTVTKKTSIGHDLNDDLYHKVEIKRFGKSTTIKVDAQEKVLASSKETLEINSFVFIGGPPIKERNNWLKYEKRFIGCIKNIRYHGEQTPSLSSEQRLARIEESHSISKGCQDKCLSEPTLECENGGGCLNMYVKTGCDCRGTGFTGKTCQQRTESISLSEQTYIVWTPRQNMNPYVAELSVRFKSVMSHGVLLFAKSDNEDDGYILLELFQKILIFTSKTNGYKEKMIQFGDLKFNRTTWYFVKIIRSRNKISLTVSDGQTERQYTHTVGSENSLFNIQEVFIGGTGDVTDSIVQSKGKTQFTGCLQDVVVNKIDLIALTSRNDSNITIIGDKKELRGCNIGNVYGTDFNKLYPSSPTLETGEGEAREIRVDTRKSVNEQIDQRSDVHNKSKKKTGSGDDSTTIMWIIGCSVGGVLLVALVIVVITRHVRHRRAEKHRQYTQRYLRQTAMTIEEDLLPTEQKCIRDEIAKRNMQSFSPFRRAFYVSQSEHGSIPRSATETFHHGHEVLNHNHPCLSQCNYAVPVQTGTPRHQQKQQQQQPLQRHHQSPQCSHYAVSRKCSHGSGQYQTPKTKADSINSFGSHQS